MSPKELLENIQKMKAQRDLLVQQEKEAREQSLHAEVQAETAKAGREVIRSVALATQKTLEYKFAGLVSAALETVFMDEAYSFQPQFIERRNKTECDLLLERNGDTFPPLDAAGGGVVDTVSWGLRLSYWALKKTRPVFNLDEPFKFLSESYHERASLQLSEISEQLGIQIIMVSHLPKMVGYADKVFTVTDGTIR